MSSNSDKDIQSILKGKIIAVDEVMASLSVEHCLQLFESKVEESP